MNARFALARLLVSAVLTCSCAIPEQRVENVELVAPPVIEAGSELDVHWKGPNLPGDSVQLVPKGTSDGEFCPDLTLSATAGRGNLRAPERGDYELRYVVGTGEGQILARTLVRVN